MVTLPQVLLLRNDEAARVHRLALSSNIWKTYFEEVDIFGPVEKVMTEQDQGV